jgi:hypothetical protein
LDVLTNGGLTAGSITTIFGPVACGRESFAKSISQNHRSRVGSSPFSERSTCQYVLISNEGVLETDAEMLEDYYREWARVPYYDNAIQQSLYRSNFLHRLSIVAQKNNAAAIITTQASRKLIKQDACPDEYSTPMAYRLMSSVAICLVRQDMSVTAHVIKNRLGQIGAFALSLGSSAEMI